MSEIANLGLSGVPETSLIPLYLRVVESQRPDAQMTDEKAETSVAQMSYNFVQVRLIPMVDGSEG